MKTNNNNKICEASWIKGDKPVTPNGTATQMWVTTKHKELGRLGVRYMTYLNNHIMACADNCDPPDCAVPHKPEADGYCEEYEWTGWTEGNCEHCETEWMWSNNYVEIIAHAFMSPPKPFKQDS